MDWLTDSDQAMKALALRQAEEIEKVIDRAEELAKLRREPVGDEGALRRLRALESMCEVIRIVGRPGPQFQGVLRDLGGTPAVRKAMKGDPQGDEG
ncbi:terminase small subunit [Streptosporangium sp. CA-135522]|uniref:terminase small subunit n=1 Tax=Streptosporangium sp. CA-135522 TaxID=3240072 RepID=UPI003D92B1F6